MKSYRVFLMHGRQTRGTYEYTSTALPAVGDTIFVRGTELDADGYLQTVETEPVPALVSRVRAGVITAAVIDVDGRSAPRPVSPQRPARSSSTRHEANVSETTGPEKIGEEDSRESKTSERADEGAGGLEAERKASTTLEYPSNVTRSTQDLTVGGDKKDPQAADRPGEEATDSRSAAQQAVTNHDRALESGAESLG